MSLKLLHQTLTQNTWPTWGHAVSNKTWIPQDCKRDSSTGTAWHVFGETPRQNVLPDGRPRGVGLRRVIILARRGFTMIVTALSGFSRVVTTTVSNLFGAPRRSRAILPLLAAGCFGQTVRRCRILSRVRLPRQHYWHMRAFFRRFLLYLLPPFFCGLKTANHRQVRPLSHSGAARNAPIFFAAWDAFANPCHVTRAVDPRPWKSSRFTSCPFYTVATALADHVAVWCLWQIGAG